MSSQTVRQWDSWRRYQIYYRSSSLTEHCIVKWGLNVSIVTATEKLCFTKLKQKMSLTIKNLSLVLVLLKRVMMEEEDG